MNYSNHWILSLDTVLLLVLGTAHLWFNPTSSALLVTLMAIYVLVSLLVPQMPDEKVDSSWRERLIFVFRIIIVLFVVIFAILTPVWMNVSARLDEGSATHANDGLIQTEEAIKFLLKGMNPYTVDYLATPLADWKGGEPPWTPIRGPLYHNAYLPFLFIGSIPFYLFISAVLGWYDQRILYVLIYLEMLLLLPLITRRARDKLSLLCAVGLNFQFVYFLYDGRNDVVILFGLLLTTVFLIRQNFIVASLVLGLTLGVKHFAWLSLPFYALYLIGNNRDRHSVLRGGRYLVVTFLVVGVIILPFLIWDAYSFIDDTVLYLIGGTADSYPIRGWGFGTLLLAIGIITSPESPFPFVVLEVVFGIPTLILLLRWQWRENTLKRVWIGFAGFSFVVQYFSRFFNDNYAIFVLQALVIGALMSPYRWQTESSDAR